jgi:hypothetical protein
VLEEDAAVGIDIGPGVLGLALLGQNLGGNLKQDDTCHKYGI